MHFELWGLRPANLIATPQSEDEGLALVRDLIEAGWKAEDLSLGLEPDDESEEATLQPALQGAVLRERAYQYA